MRILTVLQAGDIPGEGVKPSHALREAWKLRESTGAELIVLILCEQKLDGGRASWQIDADYVVVLPLRSGESASYTYIGIVEIIKWVEKELGHIDLSVVPREYDLSDLPAVHTITSATNTSDGDAAAMSCSMQDNALTLSIALPERAICYRKGWVPVFHYQPPRVPAAR